MEEGGEWEALRLLSSDGGGGGWQSRVVGGDGAGGGAPQHLQLQVVLASLASLSRGTCSCRCCWHCRRRPWTPAAAGGVGVVVIVRVQLQLQLLLVSALASLVSSMGTCSCRPGLRDMVVVVTLP